MHEGREMEQALVEKGGKLAILIIGQMLETVHPYHISLTSSLEPSVLALWRIEG